MCAIEAAYSWVKQATRLALRGLTHAKSVYKNHTRSLIETGVYLSKCVATPSQ